MKFDTAVVGAAAGDDSVHLGSNTKAITATLAAIAVERGLLGWSSSAPAVLDVEGSPGIEEVTGATWEALLRSWVAEPLSIKLNVGWSSDLPGHYEREGRLVRHDQADGYYVPTSIAPAGDVNATIAAYGRFVQLHLRGLGGRPELIGLESFNRLHSPVGGAFALGWGIQPWEGARTSVHLGSAGTFYALVAVQPERDLAVAVMTNAGGDRAEAASVSLARHLIGSQFD